MSSLCPNCKVPVTVSGYGVYDAAGNYRPFHSNCWIDVMTGWSGGPLFYEPGETPEQAYERCMRTNFRCVGIELSPRTFGNGGGSGR